MSMKMSAWVFPPLVSLLLFVMPNRHHLVGVLGEQPLTSTVPVHRCDWQAPRVLPGVILWPVPKPPYQQPQDSLLVPGVVHEPPEHKLGPTRLERVWYCHLRLLGSACGVHRSRRHHVVAAHPVRESVLVNQVSSPVRLQHLVRPCHFRVELVLPVWFRRYTQSPLVTDTRLGWTFLS